MISKQPIFFFPSSISDLERVIDTRILNLKNHALCMGTVARGDEHGFYGFIYQLGDLHSQSINI